MNIETVAWRSIYPNKKRIEVTSRSLGGVTYSFGCDKSTCGSCTLRFRCWTSRNLEMYDDELKKSFTSDGICDADRCKYLEKYLKGELNARTRKNR